MIQQVGVLVLQPDDERVREIFHVGPADGADGRAHLHGLAVHQHPNILLQTEPAQRRNHGVLPHYLLPEYPVGVLHGNVNGVGQLSAGHGADQIARAFACQQPAAGENHPHIANRILHVVGFLAVDVDGYVFQRFIGCGDTGSAPQGIERNRIVFPGQTKGHGVEVAFGAVNGVRD